MTYISKAGTQLEWDEFVMASPEANFLSSWAMGEATSKAGKKTIRTMVLDEATDQVVAVIRASVVNARRGKYLELGGNPILDWTNPQLAEFVLTSIKQMAVAEGAVFARIRPQVVKSAVLEDLYKIHKLKPAPMHLQAEHTSMLNLEPDYNQIKLNMRKKTRYQINQATKQGLKVTKETSADIYEAFLKLQLETAERQGFSLGNPDSQRAEFQALHEAGLVVIYSAYKDDKLLAQAMIVTFNNEADYLYGASTLDGRDYPGAYAALDLALQDAKANGCTRFNFWGTAPADKPDHRFAQITTFKNGFGGEVHQYMPAHDLVTKPIAYLKSYMIEATRRRRRKL